MGELEPDTLIRAWRWVWVMMATGAVGLGLFTVQFFWRTNRPVRLLAMVTITFACVISVASRLEAGLGGPPLTWRDFSSPAIITLSLATFLAVMHHEGRFE